MLHVCEEQSTVHKTRHKPAVAVVFGENVAALVVRSCRLPDLIYLPTWEILRRVDVRCLAQRPPSSVLRSLCHLLAMESHH